VEAHLVRSRLEAAGLQAFLTDEHIVSVQWLYSSAVGGVKVVVPEADLEEAREILAPPPARHSARFVTDDLQAPRCPRCGSLEIEKHFSRRVTFASSIFLGFPLPLLSRRTLCKTCGARWRPR
jgi:predicted Zn-ribbon and HTH transcriptional regulator